MSFVPQVGFLISPVMTDEHVGVYTCRAEYAGKISEHTDQITVLTKTRYDFRMIMIQHNYVMML